MSKGDNKRAAQTVRRTRKPRRRRRRSRKVDPLVLVGGAVVLLVALLVTNLWQTGAFAPPPVPSRSQEPAELLPLAEAGRPLKGDHDMARIPKQTPAPQPAPEGAALARLDLPNDSHDFGLVPTKPDVAHVFAVQNTGTADLEIRNLVTSCACTVAELSSRVIPPGQRADLTVTFDPDYHATQGEVTRLVWFATNDPTQPWVEIRIIADVES